MYDISPVTLASETREIPVWLLEITHESLTEPIRISSDATELYGESGENGDPAYCTRHQGKTYITGTFSFVPPGSPDDGSSPQARLVIAFEERIIQAVRDIHDGLYVRGVMVWASDPDTVVGEIPRLLLKSISYNAAQIDGILGLDHFLDEPVPRLQCVPSLFPAAFKNSVVKS